MRAQRIKSGFRRIAIVGAVICGIPAGLIFAMVAYFLLIQKPGDAGEAAMLGGAWVIGAAVVYAAARSLGWIVAGFAGDGEEISN